MDSFSLPQLIDLYETYDACISVDPTYMSDKNMLI